MGVFFYLVGLTREVRLFVLPTCPVTIQLLAMARREENMVLFPFMALALQIEQRTNYAVTIVNTPLCG
ncbi:Glycosyltransferase [Quillaja saponaria]|uniref:Glycosyltransferase n=1 Tax=Quillaja saponaria TaxID=32244 RepID=A0AAD7KWY4_QUISA|nr:Glycosyltransferase [Quillaja saponaria]